MALILTAIACGSDARGSAAAPPAVPAPDKPVPVLAVRASAALAAELREGGFFRWGLPRLSGLRVEVGPEAAGDVEVWLDRLPVSPPTANLLAGLPVRCENAAIVLGGTRYEAAGQALALRLPEAEKPTWIVVGPRGDGWSDLADEVLFRLANSLTGRERGRRRLPLDVDYLLRETPWMERSGRWTKAAAGGWTLDAAGERDDLANWQKTFAAMAEIRRERVILRVAASERDRPELVRLAADLDQAAAAMAPRVPVTLASPITVIVEPDYVAQGRHTGDIGEAVPGTRADLHLVYDPADGPAYRHALAGALLARAGLTGKLAVGLQRGAALWLSGDWYGQRYPEWLPLLAAARVLPAAAELLAAREPPDGSAVLWTPAAAAIVERLPGETVAEKLKGEPAPARVEEILRQLQGGSSSLPPSRPAHSPSVPFLKGVSLAMANSLEGGYHAPAIDEQLAVLRRLGANAVSLMPFAYQPGADRPELRFLNRGPGSETDIGLIHATRLARRRGFHVLYKPHLWISGGSWPGDVHLRTEADWAAWWQSYRRYILHHAVLARWAGADLFSVGVELSRTVEREAEWRDLIAATRRFFPGPVTYSGNWYGDLENVKFWDRLDFIGVDAYFPLAASAQAGGADLARGAKGIAARLEAASRRWGKPVLLTEVGFAARRGAWMEPHVEGGDYSEDDQALAYRALFAALQRRPWLAGTFLWKTFSAPWIGGGEADFRFLGRKAEGIVRQYYGGAR